MRWTRYSQILTPERWFEIPGTELQIIKYHVDERGDFIRLRRRGETLFHIFSNGSEVPHMPSVPERLERQKAGEGLGPSISADEILMEIGGGWRRFDQETQEVIGYPLEQFRVHTRFGVVSIEADLELTLAKQHYYTLNEAANYRVALDPASDRFDKRLLPQKWHKIPRTTLRMCLNFNGYRHGELRIKQGEEIIVWAQACSRECHKGLWKYGDRPQGGRFSTFYIETEFGVLHIEPNELISRWMWNPIPGKWGFVKRDMKGFRVYLI